MNGSNLPRALSVFFSLGFPVLLAAGVAAQAPNPAEKPTPDTPRSESSPKYVPPMPLFAETRDGGGGGPLHDPMNGVPGKLIQIDISGVESWDLFDDPDNTVLLEALGEGACMTGVGWDVTLTTVGASWLSEAVTYFDGSDLDGSGLFLTVGASDGIPGTMTYTSGGILDLTDNGIANIPIGDDGLLYLQFFESFDDVSDAVDARYEDDSFYNIAYLDACTNSTPSRPRTFAIRGDKPQAVFDRSRRILATWQRQSPDPAGNGIFVQTFAPGPVGAEMLIGPGGRDPAVAYDAREDVYLVVWQQELTGGEVSCARDRICGLRLRRGMPLGNEFQISEPSGNAELRHPDVVHDSKSGEFFVVWQTSSGDSIRGRRVLGNSPSGSEFRISGKPLGNDFQVATPRVAADQSGEQLVVWQYEQPQSANFAIRGRRLRGMPLGNEFEVSLADRQVQRTPDVAYEHSSETFVAVWHAEDKGAGSILGRRIPAGNPPQGAEIQISEPVTMDRPALPRIAGGDDLFSVVWQDDSDRPDSDIFSRFLSASGLPLGSPFEVSVDGSRYQDIQPSTDFVPSDGTGLIIVWSRRPPGRSGTSPEKILPLTTSGLTVYWTNSGSDPLIDAEPHESTADVPDIPTVSPAGLVVLALFLASAAWMVLHRGHTS